MTEENDVKQGFDFENHRLQAIEKYQKLRPWVKMTLVDTKVKVQY